MDGALSAHTARTPRAVSVPVRGGDLHVAVWEADAGTAEDADGVPTVLAVHGVTSSHLAWELLADALPDVRVVAPDLRGRGRSNAVDGPAGMAAHADDLAAVCAALELGSVPVVAHSMGAFVALTFAARHPALVSRLVLVDGGLPIDAPPGLSPDALVAAILGPTAERLKKRFASVDAYLDFWRGHPAFQRDWSPALERYLAYDLVPDEQHPALLRPATSYATTVEDTIDMNATTVVADSLAALAHPATLITVSRGLRDEEPGLYAEDHLARVLAAHPGIRHERWPGFNHYTVVMSAAGAELLAARVREAVSAR